MRTTNARSVVTAIAVGGTNSDGRGRRVGQITSGNIPGASLPDEFATSSSTGIVRVLASSEWLERRMTPLKVSPGKAGSVKSIRAPDFTPSISVSGTKTI